MNKARPLAMVWILMAPVALALDPMPSEADDLQLDEKQRAIITHGTEVLGPTLTALEDACGRLPLEFDWHVFLSMTKPPPGELTALEAYVRDCGASLEGVADACRGPQRAKVLGRVKQLVCTEAVAGTRKPPGTTDRSAWEPEFEGTKLVLGFSSRVSKNHRAMVSGFLERQFPPDAPPRFEGETQEQKSALDKAESTARRSLDEVERVCHNRPKLIIDIDGFQAGDPHPNRSSAERVESVASTYYQRCTGAIEAVRYLCDRFGEPASSLSKIVCHWSDTDDGYRTGSKRCEVRRNASVLIAECGWYQRVEYADVCKALNGDKCIAKDDDDDDVGERAPREERPKPSKAAKPPTAAPERECKVDGDCGAGRRCKWGECTEKPRQLSGRGGPCTTSRDCHGGATCFAHKCE